MTFAELANMTAEEQRTFLWHIRHLIEKAVQSLSDTDALDCVTLFPSW